MSFLKNRILNFISAYTINNQMMVGSYYELALHKGTPEYHKHRHFVVSNAVYHLGTSKRKAMNRNWSNQNANPALKTKAGNK